MPNIMFRQHDDGLYGYIAKRDLEARVSSIEFDSEECWGGRIELDSGEAYFLEPMDKKPRLPATVRVKRAAE